MQLTENFSLSEFTCHDAAGTPVPERYMDNVKEVAHNLQVLRYFLEEPVHVNCGYRTPAHNAAVGGVPNSQHLTASAADICVKSKTPLELKSIIEMLIAKGKMKQGGLGLYPGFVHYDIRGTLARW